MAGSDITDIVKGMAGNPKGVRFRDLCQVCRYYFGEPRQSSSSHRIYRKPWKGDPRVNIQNDKNMAKPYQVRQVLAAIKRLNDENTDKH